MTKPRLVNFVIFFKFENKTARPQYSHKSHKSYKSYKSYKSHKSHKSYESY
ncbi:MAG: hypothetical protein AB7J40_03375 [Candidatus Altimarinota bacterium]